MTGNAIMKSIFSVEQVFINDENGEHMPVSLLNVSQCYLIGVTDHLEVSTTSTKNSNLHHLIFQNLQGNTLCNLIPEA